MSRPQELSTAGPVSYIWVARSRSESTSQFTALTLNKSSSSAGTVALTPARCLLTEANTTLLDSTVA